MRLEGMLPRNLKDKAYWNKSLVIGLGVFLLFILTNTGVRALNKVVDKTTKINEYKVISEQLLGVHKPTKILILFQNNAESRPGGGFIGTVGYVTIDKGKIKSEPVRSVYYYDYQIRLAKEAAEQRGEDTQVYNGVIRDSGQYLDWPTNAKSAIKLFELQPGKEVDMVVGLTPEVLKFLLNQTGPVYLEDYKKTITASNIIETLQQEVEYGQDKAEGKDPKTVLSEVANQLIVRLNEKSLLDLGDLGRDMQELLRGRQITIYSKDYEVGMSLKRLGFDGSIVGTPSDYFLLTENNFSVDKSNAFIDRQMERSAVIDQDGGVVIDVKLIRNQTLEQSFPYVDPRDPEGRLTHLVRPNKSYMKFAIPKNSKIIGNSENIVLEKKDSEGGYDVYQFVSELTPLVPSEYQISYKLPFKLGGQDGSVLNTYIQYPNGGWPYRLKQTVKAPQGWVLGASNHSNITTDTQTVMYNNEVTKDFYWSVVYAKN